MKELLAIIPARGGSKSIPRKNIKPINGKPMIVYSIEACQKSKLITRFVVSTEDKEIAEISQSHGAEVINRPIELAQDETKTAPVMLQVTEELEKSGYKPDYVVLIQPTSPFRDEILIDKALEFFFNHPDCDSCFSGFSRGITHGLWRQERNGGLKGLYDYHNRPRRQDESEHYNLYSENGAFYAIKYDAFKNLEDFVGDNPCIFLSDFHFDIDEESDFKKAEEILKSQA